jgi:hypothetical protein
VQGKHTKSVTRCTNPPNECSGVLSGTTSAKVATNRMTIAMPLARA